MTLSLEAVLAERPNDQNFQKKLAIATRSTNLRSEVKRLRKQVERANPADLPPVVNQTAALEEFILALASTEYPYAVLVGDGGIGKSQLLKLATRVLGKDIDIDRVKRWFPSVAPHFETLLKPEIISEYRNRAYMTLPNLLHPRKVEALSYSDSRQLEIDTKIATDFCRSMAALIDTFPIEKRETLRRCVKIDEFDTHVTSVVTDAISRSYKEFSDWLGEREYVKGDRSNAGVVATVKPLFSNPDNPDTAIGKLEVVLLTEKASREPNYDLMSASELLGDKDRSSVTRDETERKLNDKLYSRKIKRILDQMIHELSYLDVVDDEGDVVMEHEEKIRSLKRRFNELSEQASGLVSNLYEDESSRTVPVASLVPTYVNSNLFHGISPEVRISKTGIEGLLADVERIRSSAIRGIGPESRPSDDLVERLNGICRYFTEERDNIEQRMKRVLEEIENLEKEDDDLVISKSGLASATGKKPTPKQIKEARKRAFANINLLLQHGSFAYNGKTLFQVGELGSVGNRDISTVNIEDFSDTEVIGDIEAASKDLPYHMTIKSLGDFFKGGIISFGDAFEDFVRWVTGTSTTNSDSEQSDARKAARLRNQRQRFLDYLQDKHFSFNVNGTNYSLYAPRILVASNNGYPFFSIHQGGIVREEVGLASRISTINVPNMVEDNTDSRRGTVQVITRALRNANNRGKPISISDDALNYLLRDRVVGDYMHSLQYRDLEKEIEALRNLAMANKGDEITLEIILEKYRRDKFRDGFFLKSDLGARDVDGFFFADDMRYGESNIIGVNEDGSASGRTVKSELIPDLFVDGFSSRRFEFVDSKTGLSDHSAAKGFEVAQHYVMRLLAGLIPGYEDHGVNKDLLNENSRWGVRSIYPNSYGSGGPSASASTAISILSELFGIPINKHVFYTGTMRDASGSIGQIGGTYYKSLVPWRFATKLADQYGIDDCRTAFVFPMSNLRELNDLKRKDVFGAIDSDRVTYIPVGRIETAFAIGAHDGPITKPFLKGAYENGRELIIQGLKSAEERLERLAT